jgi:hypothetical protein
MNSGAFEYKSIGVKSLLVHATTIRVTSLRSLNVYFLLAIFPFLLLYVSTRLTLVPLCRHHDKDADVAVLANQIMNKMNYSSSKT